MEEASLKRIRDIASTIPPDDQYETTLADTFLTAQDPVGLFGPVGGRTTKNNKGFHVDQNMQEECDDDDDEKHLLPPTKRLVKSGGIVQSQALDLIRYERIFIKDRFNTVTSILSEYFNRYPPPEPPADKDRAKIKRAGAGSNLEDIFELESTLYEKLCDQLTGLQQHLMILCNAAI